MQSGNRYRSVLFIVCACLSFSVMWSVTAFGEEPAKTEPVLETREVVISATKTPVPVTQLTSAVEVITGEELERRHVKTVVDALRLSQGVTVFSNGGPGTSSTVRIRGSNTDQVLVVIDGAIMNSATLGSFNFANLTTDNIERIEILRGAQSMLWGADAMGGVINITTKKGTGAPSASAFFEYGSFSSIREGGQVSGKTGPVDFSVALSRWDYTGFSAVNYRRGASERDGFHNWQTSARLGIALPHEGRLDFNFRLLQGRTNFDGGFGPGFDVLGAFTNSQQFVYSASYSQPITTWWNQALTVSRQTEDFESFSGTTQRNLQTGVVSPTFASRSQIDTLANRVEWQHNVQVGKPLLLTAGYQFRDQQGENRDLLTNNLDIPHKVLSSHAGFAQAQLNLWDRVFATAGVRQDEYNVFGSATTYRATGGYLHQETGTKLRGSYATGFRAPTFNQLYFPNFGNPGLKPEKSQSMDIGVDQYLLDNRLTLSGGFFWNHFRDMIVSQQSLAVCGPDIFFGDPNGAFCAQNIGAVSTKGWEASIKYAVVKDMPFVKSLDVQAQYTNTLTRDLALQPGNRAPRIPVDQWSMVVSYQPIEPLRINLEGRYVGSRFNDVNNQQPMRAFDVWNISASYNVTNRVQTYVRLDNIFNEKYEEILLFGTPVRSIFVGLRVNYDAK